MIVELEDDAAVVARAREPPDALADRLRVDGDRCDIGRDCRRLAASGAARSLTSASRAFCATSMSACTYLVHLRRVVLRQLQPVHVFVSENVVSMATSPMLALSLIVVTLAGSFVMVSTASVNVSPFAVVTSTAWRLVAFIS